MVQLEQFLAAYDHRANTRLALPDVHTNCGSPTRFPELITYNDPLIACALPAHASHAPSARRGSRLSARGPLALNFARRAGPGALCKKARLAPLVFQTVTLGQAKKLSGNPRPSYLIARCVYPSRRQASQEIARRLIYPKDPKAADAAARTAGAMEVALNSLLLSGTNPA